MIIFYFNRIIIFVVLRMKVMVTDKVEQRKEDIVVINQVRDCGDLDQNVSCERDEKFVQVGCILQRGLRGFVGYLGMSFERRREVRDFFSFFFDYL